MGTPVEHNEGKPTYNSPCVTRKATPEELAEIDKQIKEKNPFGLEGSPSVSYTFPKKEKKKADKLTREEFNAQRKAKQAENIEKCRKLAEQGLTKHEISERTGIATKTIERYAQKNGFRYAHKTDKRILEKREKALKDVMQSDGSVSLEKLMGKLEKEDVVNHPSHYTTGKIEVIDFIEDKGLDYHRSNAIKYICRAGLKNPAKRVEDLQKAVWYLNRLIGKWKIEDNL